jgi:hypothetical protein
MMSSCPVLDKLLTYAAANPEMQFLANFTTYLLDGTVPGDETQLKNGFGTLKYIPGHILGVPEPLAGDVHLPIVTPSSFGGPVTYNGALSTPIGAPLEAALQITVPESAEFTYSVALLIQEAEAWSFAPECIPNVTEGVLGGVVYGVCNDVFIAMVIGDVQAN